MNINICNYVCKLERSNVCMCVFVYSCMYVCVCLGTFLLLQIQDAQMYAMLFSCYCKCVCVCMCVFLGASLQTLKCMLCLFSFEES